MQNLTENNLNILIEWLIIELSYIFIVNFY